MAVQFNGSTYYSIATPDTFGSSLPVSMCAWVKSPLTIQEGIVSVRGTSGELVIHITGAQLGDAFTANQTYYSSQRMAQILWSSANTWYFIGARFISNTSRYVYRNTTSVWNGDNPLFITCDGNLHIGWKVYGNQITNSAIASAAFWDADIGDTAMKAMGGSGGEWLGPNLFPNNLVSHARLDTLDRYDEVMDATWGRTGTGDTLVDHPAINYGSDPFGPKIQII